MKLTLKSLADRSLRTREHRIAFVIALGLFGWLISGPLLTPIFFEESVYLPLLKVLENVPFARKIGIGWLFIIPIVWFFACYFIIKSYLLASRHFQSAIVALVVVGTALALALHEQRSRIDWTSRGLNPNRPGFKPQVVVLSGTIEWGYFEIRMRGADYYYCKTWNKAEWKPGAWSQLELDIPDFAMHLGLHCGRFGSGGGGGSSLGGPEDLVLARRLWSGTTFIGAKTNETVAEEREWGIREEFHNLETVGPWLIPKLIKFSTRLAGEETYTIKKVEFWNQPSTNWFLEVKHAHFDPGFTRTNDLHEPGPLPWRR